MSSLLVLHRLLARVMLYYQKLESLFLKNWQSLSGVSLGIRWMKRGLVGMPRMLRTVCLKLSRMGSDQKQSLEVDTSESIQKSKR